MDNVKIVYTVPSLPQEILVEKMDGTRCLVTVVMAVPPLTNETPYKGIDPAQAGYEPLPDYMYGILGLKKAASARNTDSQSDN